MLNIQYRHEKMGVRVHKCGTMMRESRGRGRAAKRAVSVQTRKITPKRKCYRTNTKSDSRVLSARGQPRSVSFHDSYAQLGLLSWTALDPVTSQPRLCPVAWIVHDRPWYHES